MPSSAARKSPSEIVTSTPEPPRIHRGSRQAEAHPKPNRESDWERKQRWIAEYKLRGIDFDDFDARRLTPEGFAMDEEADPTAPPPRPPRCKLTNRELYETIKPHLEANGLDFDDEDENDEPSFEIGKRPVYRRDEDGSLDFVKDVPLSRADALYPMECDELVGNWLHGFAIQLLWGIAYLKLHEVAGFRCYSDTAIDVGIIGHGKIRPDLAVMTGMVHQLDPLRGTIYLGMETAEDFRCRLAIEVTSEKTRQNDIVHKRGIYADAGFEQYVIVHLPRKRKPDQPIQLDDMRPVPGVYMDPLPRRKSGRVPLVALGVWLGVRNGDLTIFESERGRRIEDYPSALRAWERSKRRAERSKKQLAAAKEEAAAAKEETAELTRRLKEVEEELRRLQRGE